MSWKPQSNLSFHLMALKFRLRDRLHSPEKILDATGIKPGMTILDYGCGPGSFSIQAAKMVGTEGRILALDINPLALQYVQKAAEKEGLNNIQLITAEQFESIPDASVDMILLYDVLHCFTKAPEVLARIRRVLKNDGILSVGDHNLRESTVFDKVTTRGLFIHANHTRWTIEFTPGK